MKTHTVKFTLGEINHILGLIADNRRSQTHYGNRKQWEAQQRNIIDKFALVEEQILADKRKLRAEAEYERSR
jgi:uncharacterized protein (DUF362 family)